MGACTSDPKIVEEKIDVVNGRADDVEYNIGDAVDPMAQMNVDQSGGMMQYGNYQNSQEATQGVTVGDMNYGQNYGQMSSGTVGGGGNVYDPAMHGQYFASVEEAQKAAAQSNQAEQNLPYNSAAQQNMYSPQNVGYQQNYSSGMQTGQGMANPEEDCDDCAPIVAPTGEYAQFAQAGGHYQGQGMAMMEQPQMVDPQMQAYGAQMDSNQMPTDADGVAYENEDNEAVAEAEQKGVSKKKKGWFW